MIKVKISEILLLLQENNIRTCIFDFDFTLTSLDSCSSIGILNDKINNKYKKKKKILDIFTKYFRTKLLYKKIWNDKMRLLRKNNYEKYLKNINISSYFKPNKEVIILIRKLIKMKFKIIIYSSGLDFVIKKFLIKNNIYSESIEIIANNPNRKEKIITPFKNKLNINGKCACFGDQLNDLNLSDNCLNILVTGNKFYIK